MWGVGEAQARQCFQMKGIIRGKIRTFCFYTEDREQPQCVVEVAGQGPGVTWLMTAQSTRTSWPY